MISKLSINPNQPRPAQNLYLNFFSFYFEFKNTSNLIFPSFKVPSESFLFKNLKTGLTFCHRWFFNFQNLARSCQHILGHPVFCENHEYEFIKKHQNLTFIVDFFCQESPEFFWFLTFNLSLNSNFSSK